LRNADKHTENGAVTIRAESSGGDITVTVSDTGAGIEPDLLPRIFERGVYGEGGESGFGLAICRDIITAYGGKIWIDSEPGKGTAAAFSLPRYTS
jgi:signal transduction histidine kinase